MSILLRTARAIKPLHITQNARIISSTIRNMSVGIPEDKDHATGVEKEELDYGEDRYNRDALSGPYGTKESPVLVPSKLDNRFVGCLGGGERGVHHLLWFNITKGKLYACPECDQVFKLVDEVEQ